MDMEKIVHENPDGPAGSNVNKGIRAREKRQKKITTLYLWEDQVQALKERNVDISALCRDLLDQVLQQYEELEALRRMKEEAQRRGR